MNTVAILLSAFVLSFVALLVFVWSQRTGRFDRSSRGAEVIFAAQEISRIEDPSATRAEQGALQSNADAAAGAQAMHADADELVERVRADASTGPLVLFFYCCAVI